MTKCDCNLARIESQMYRIGDVCTIQVAMCTQCRCALEISIQSKKELEVDTEPLTVHRKDKESYLRSDWIRCPRCLNPDVELSRSGIVECDQCDLEKELSINDR